MDVWAVLSLIANIAMQLWNEAASLAAAAPLRFAIAAACLIAALVLLLFAAGSAAAKRRAPDGFDDYEDAFEDEEDFEPEPEPEPVRVRVRRRKRPPAPVRVAAPKRTSATRLPAPKRQPAPMRQAAPARLPAPVRQPAATRMPALRAMIDDDRAQIAPPKRRKAVTIEDDDPRDAPPPKRRTAAMIEDDSGQITLPKRRKAPTADDAFAAHAHIQTTYRAFAEEEPPSVWQPRPRPRLPAPAPAPTSPGLPALPPRQLSTRDIIARLEAKRGSRVVAIIHRENMERSFLDVADLEDALTAIRKTPKDKPLDVVIHSPGGHIRVGQQIARAIHAHPAHTTVFVPYFALGATTFMAIAADEIVMSDYAALSPVDPYAVAGPASSVLKGIENKPIDLIDDETVICADMAHKMLDEARRVTCELMEDKGDHDGVCALADELVSGKWSRDRAITAQAARQLGLNVSLAMPHEVFDLVRACRRGRSNDSSVAYLDHVRAAERKAAAAPRKRPAQVPALGVFDSNLAHVTELAKAPTTGVVSSTKALLFAQEGGHLPEASVDRAKAIIRAIEKERGSRVICIIHGENMENESFNFDDLEDVLSAIVVSDRHKPLDIVLHTQGGNSFTGRQIARAIKAHQAKKTVFVPYYAMSAGSRISLAADQIVMGAQATLGPIDTQIYGWPAPSILRLLEVKPVEAISDEFLILAAEARKVMAEGRASACDLLQGTYSDDGSCMIADEMISGRWTHGFPITAGVAQGLGLNVSTDLPDVFYDLVRCFRHADGEDPSVLFIPR